MGPLGIPGAPSSPHPVIKGVVCSIKSVFKMEAAVPILTKVLEDENCEKTNTRKESSLSNRTLKDGLKSIRSKQQIVIILLLILLLVFFEVIYNLLKKK